MTQTQPSPIQPVQLIVPKKDGTSYTMYTGSPKQSEFHRSQVSKLLAWGSRGGGKSIMLRMDAHFRALTHPGCNLVLVRKTYKDLLKNHVFFQASKGIPWTTLKQEMNMLGGDFNKSDYICHYPNGSKLFLSYVGDASDALNLLGAEFLAAYFDEISTIPWDFFTQLVSSVRVSAGSDWKPVVRAATNPLGESTAEIMKYFVHKDVDLEEDRDYNPAEWDHIRMDMGDNPFLDSKQYLKDLMALNLPEHMKKAWIEGEYFEETALFSFYAQREGRPYHVIPECDTSELIHKARVFRCYDHGYKPDPAYCAWIAHLGNRYIVFHEQAWLEKSVPFIAEDIKKIDAELGVGRVVATYCDPHMDIKTGQVRTIKDLFEDHGIAMDCSVNDRRQFAAAVHAALATEIADGQPKLQIFANGPRMGCPYLARSLPMMRYDPKRPEFLADHKHDHPVVALAYFLISEASYDQHTYQPREVKPWMRPKQSSEWVLGNDGVRSR
jgi:hypothetical protein